MTNAAMILASLELLTAGSMPGHRPIGRIGPEAGGPPMPEPPKTKRDYQREKRRAKRQERIT